jgi:membrane-bound serine protease (ClpP class)
MILSILFACLSWANPAHFIEISGSINPGSSAYFMDALKQAQKENASALILQLNTPGGLLSSTRDMIQEISKSKIPVVVYVAPGGASATSAGALIALSAHVVAMAPGSNIGAAHPVASGGQDVKGDMGDKVTNDTAALARAQAELRGRPTIEAEKIVTKSQSYSAEEALTKKVIELKAASLGELLELLQKTPNPLDKNSMVLPSGISTPNKVEMNLKQKVLHFIADPNISAMLIALGGLALYAEISSGFATLIPGFVGIFCLLLGFISMQTIPINLGGALLFVLGFFFLIAEVYITSYGLLTLAAVTSLFLGGLFFIDPAAASMKVSLSILIPLVGSIGLIMATLGFILARDAKAKKVSIGALEGKKAIVSKLNADQKSGYVLLEGELWEFFADEVISNHEEVIVEKVEKLKVKIKRR